jgi:hypothetical protein
MWPIMNHKTPLQLLQRIRCAFYNSFLPFLDPIRIASRNLAPISVFAANEPAELGPEGPSAQVPPWRDSRARISARGNDFHPLVQLHWLVGCSLLMLCMKAAINSFFVIARAGGTTLMRNKFGMPYNEICVLF